MTSDNDLALFASYLGKTPRDYAAAGWSVAGLFEDLRRRGHERDAALVGGLAAILEAEGLPMAPAPDLATLTPEEQISNVLASLLDLVEGPALPGRLGQIRATARQLDALWQAYQRGDLAPIEDFGDIPF